MNGNSIARQMDEACRNALPVGNILSGDQLCLAIRKAMGINAASQRIIIDAKCGEAVRVYVQLLGDDRLLTLDLDVLLRGAEIR